MRALAEHIAYRSIAVGDLENWKHLLSPPLIYCSASSEAQAYTAPGLFITLKWLLNSIQWTI